MPLLDMLRESLQAPRRLPQRTSKVEDAVSSRGEAPGGVAGSGHECATLAGPRGGGPVGKLKCGPALGDLRLAEEDQIRPVVLPVRVVDPRVRSRERTGRPWVGRELGQRSEFPRADVDGVGARSDTSSAQAAQALRTRGGG